MPFLSGKLTDTRDLDLITRECEERYSHITKAHHEWINDVRDPEFRRALDTVRSSPEIYASMHEKFPNSRIYPVTEGDEIYWTVSPKQAGGSDRSLVDCHYDAPFAWIPNGGVSYYRVIVATNENNTVTTVFPTENASTKMTTGDYHGLDHSMDWHCVDGQIAPGKHRILLKMHYLIVPNTVEDSGWPDFVLWINMVWTKWSRKLMRMSAEPSNLIEWLAAALVNICRIVFNNYLYFVIPILLGFCYYAYSQLFVTNRRRRI